MHFLVDLRCPLSVSVHDTGLTVNVPLAGFACFKENISFNYILESFKSLSLRVSSSSVLHAVVCMWLTGALLSCKLRACSSTGTALCSYTLTWEQPNEINKYNR